MDTKDVPSDDMDTKDVPSDDIDTKDVPSDAVDTKDVPSDDMDTKDFNTGLYRKIAFETWTTRTPVFFNSNTEKTYTALFLHD
jgi:hypothetical protein